jgi:hypothetical protein
LALSVTLVAVSNLSLQDYEIAPNCSLSVDFGYSSIPRSINYIKNCIINQIDIQLKIYRLTVVLSIYYIEYTQSLAAAGDV